MNDEDFMREALRLARNAEGRTTPNPLVGAVIVREGRIIAAGNAGSVCGLQLAGRCKPLTSGLTGKG